MSTHITSGSVDISPSREDNLNGTIIPFNESSVTTMRLSSIVNFDAMDTSGFDAYRQGVELTQEKYYQMGSFKIHSGETETGHRIPQFQFGMDIPTKSKLSIPFDDSKG